MSRYVFSYEKIRIVEYRKNPLWLQYADLIKNYRIGKITVEG